MTVQAINGATPFSDPFHVTRCRCTERFFPVRKFLYYTSFFLAFWQQTSSSRRLCFVRLPLIDIPVPCASSLLRTHSLRGHRHHLRHPAEIGLTNSPKVYRKSQWTVKRGKRRTGNGISETRERDEKGHSTTNVEGSGIEWKGREGKT